MSRTAVDVGGLTTIVLNWNQPELTIRAVESLVDDGVQPERIVVVDNGSTDGSRQVFAERLGDCVRVLVAENVGFARGNNIGARQLAGEAYLFVNSDAFVHRPGSVAALVESLNRDGVGVVVPRLLNEDLTLQPSVSPAPRAAAALVRASGLSRLVPNDRQPRWSTHWDHGESRAIEYAVGAVVLVRGGLWEAMGGYPETSFMYAEDLGLCLEAARRGATVWFRADAEFVHLGGSSSGARWTDESRAERIGRANAALIREHLDPADARLTIAITRAGLAMRLGAWRLAGRQAAAAEQRGLLRGYGARTVDDPPAPRPTEPIVTVVRPGAS